MNPNVDHDEVNKFAVLAARWWDRNSEFKQLHDKIGRASCRERV